MASSITSLSIFIMVLLFSSKGTMPQEINIGVCYGTLGNNLPPAKDAINLFMQKKWSKVRLFDPNQDILAALRDSGIQVTLGTKNEDIPTLASGIDQATSWFATNVEPHLEGLDLAYIAVGNEVVPGEFATSVPTAMNNLNQVVRNRGLTNTKVTTVVSSGSLVNSYPPSATTFSSDTISTMGSILEILSETGAPLLVTVYPYIAYVSDPGNIRLDYAHFTANDPVVSDGDLAYYSLFDAMVDGFYWAMEKAGHGNVDLVVAESGWPSAGNGEFTTTQLAATYNNKFKELIVGNRGTPKRPGRTPGGFVFALFNENLKPEGAEQNFGLFHPDMTPVYEF